jgi:D-inositol-3-phosphate glycosyltransferase
VLGGLAHDPVRLAALSRGALLHAGRFGWATTAAGVLDVYSDALLEREDRRRTAALAVGR